MPENDGGTGWPTPFSVELAEQEIHALQRLYAGARAADPRLSWLLFGLAALTGAGSAIAAIVVRAVRPERSAGLAAGAFLVCLTGMWIYDGFMVRAHRRRLRAYAETVSGAWTAVLDASGIGFAQPDGRTWIAWSRVDSARLDGTLVVIRSRLGSLTVLPVRCLPDGWTADRLLAAVNAALGAVRSG